MRDFAREDRRVRERLEKNSIRGERADTVGFLNMAAENHVVIERGAGDVLAQLRNAAQGSRLQKAPAERPDFAEQDDARDERYIPELRAAQVRDSGGSMDAFRETRASLFGGQGVHDAMRSLSAEDYRHMVAMRLRQRFFERTYGPDLDAIARRYRLAMAARGSILQRTIQGCFLTLDPSGSNGSAKEPRSLRGCSRHVARKGKSLIESAAKCCESMTHRRSAPYPLSGEGPVARHDAMTYVTS